MREANRRSRLVIDRPEAWTVGISNRPQPPQRSSGDMPEPSFTRLDIGWRFDLFGDRVRDLISHPGPELVPFAQRTEAANRFPAKQRCQRRCEHDLNL